LPGVEDVEELAEKIEKIGNFVSQAMSTMMIILLLGDLLGINVGQLLIIAITKPWIIPWEWIVQYYTLWYGMMWTLFACMLGDQIYSMIYMNRYGKPPPPKYERWMSLAVFMLSFWLALIFRYASLTMICIFSAISFAYTMFVRSE